MMNGGKIERDDDALTSDGFQRFAHLAHEDFLTQPAQARPFELDERSGMRISCKKTDCLAQRRNANRGVNLEEAALIKERVGKVYNPLIYGRTCDLLEGKSAPKKKK